jgi:hypothetical protein
MVLRFLCAHSPVVISTDVGTPRWALTRAVIALASRRFCWLVTGTIAGPLVALGGMQMGDDADGQLADGFVAPV